MRHRIADLERHDADWLARFGTCGRSGADELKLDDEYLRYWLGPRSEHNPWDRTVTVEEYDDGNWHAILVYNGDDPEEFSAFVA